MTDVRHPGEPLSDGVVTLRRTEAAVPDVLAFDVEHGGERAGRLAVRDLGDAVGDLTWEVTESRRRHGLATRALQLLVGYAFAELDFLRLEARVPADEPSAARDASRAGLRREGVIRLHDRELILLARLRSDPEPFEPVGFRALLNSALPRKRAIAQLAVRDPAGRLLLCHLTYKQDWDFPGGVVEDDESPRAAAEREVREELGLELPAGRLLLVDWLPAWGGWDDACVFVFDGGVHEPGLTSGITPEPREVREARFCSREEMRQRCADFTVRRAEAVLSVGDAVEYLESGRRPANRG